MKQQRIEGYWYSVMEPNWPMPIPNVLSDNEAKEISDLILKKEQTAKKQSFRGFSHSRIEPGKNLGCLEYQTDEWVWPGDFRTHYVLKHKVKPSEDFLKYIGYINE